MVIVGCGFGGLFATKALRRLPVEVTLIDRTNHHLFQPLLYQVANGILSSGEIAPATRDILRRQENVRVELGTVTDIDVKDRTVTVEQMGHVRAIPYDSLIVSAGVEPSYFGHNEFSRWAPGMKTIDDALELRGLIFGAFEHAEIEPDPELRKQWLTFAIVGGGPTGVEMAGQIRELSHRALRHNFRTIDPASARVVLFEGGEHLLAGFGDRISKMTERDLRRLGVEVHTETQVVNIDEGGLEVRHAGADTTERLEARTKVWAAGMRASPLGVLLAKATGAQTDRMGRVLVEPDCSLPGHPEVFVVGDLMKLDDLPGMAEVAMQSGVHAAHCIRRRACGDTGMHPFKYRDLGSLAVISRFRAVARFGPISLGGFVGWVLWLVVHLAFLTGFKNRVTAVLRWAIAFIGRGRAERTVTDQQILARQALEREYFQSHHPEDAATTRVSRASPDAARASGSSR